jgi:hypothetical protein
VYFVRSIAGLVLVGGTKAGNAHSLSVFASRELYNFAGSCGDNQFESNICQGLSAHSFGYSSREEEKPLEHFEKMQNVLASV